MRWFHMTLITVLAIVTLIFALQNLQSVTVAFLNFRVSAPLAVLIAVYLRARNVHRRQPLGTSGSAGRYGRLEASRRAPESQQIANRSPAP